MFRCAAAVAAALSVALPASFVAAQVPATSAVSSPAAPAGPYDPGADAAADLKAAGARASVSGKRVLAVVGGNWCAWCRVLDRQTKEDSAIAGALASGFEVVKVNFSKENGNEAVRKGFGETAVIGYPYLVVLSPDLKVLKVQETGSVETGDKNSKGYDAATVLAFLGAWALPKA